MLTEISWHSYWTFIALTVALYYLMLLVMFRIKGRLAMPGNGKIFWRKQEEHTSTISEPSIESTKSDDPDFLNPAPESEEYPVYACVDEVNAFLKASQNRKCDKETLISALKGIIAKYPSIKDSQYKASLNSVIVAQCAHLCFVHLTDADLDRVWLS